jgi:hypothetical protein
VSREVLVAALVTVLVGELTGVSRWAADKVARWAARRIYLSNAQRAEERAEEWHALISESIPTSISALCFGLGLGVLALSYMTARRVATLGSLVSCASRMLSGSCMTGHDWNERHVTEQRAACLALMQAVSELKLQAADAGGDVKWIQFQAAHTQMQAARAAFLAPDLLADSAERLAVVAGQLADATAAQSSNGDQADVPAARQELEESVRVFWRAAVDMFRDLSQTGSTPQ